MHFQKGTTLPINTNGIDLRRHAEIIKFLHVLRAGILYICHAWITGLPWYRSDKTSLEANYLSQVLLICYCCSKNWCFHVCICVWECGVSVGIYHNVYERACVCVCINDCMCKCVHVCACTCNKYACMHGHVQIWNTIGWPLVTSVSWKGWKTQSF